MRTMTELVGHANEIRRDIVEMAYLAKGPAHPGPSLSIADILAALYFDAMNVNAAQPENPDRDRLLLSKGHAAPALYAALALIYTALIRFLVPAAESRRVTALLLITDPATLSLFFMGAIVLYEKTERLHAALYTAGIKPGAYLFSKCLNAAWLGALTAQCSCWFLFNPSLQFLRHSQYGIRQWHPFECVIFFSDPLNIG